MNEREMAYWCVNFDAATGPIVYEDEGCILRYGLARNFWLMQYQYAHYGHDYQDNARQRAAISNNWKAIGSIRPGDMCAAYLRGSRFFATGKVIEPRQTRTTHQDTISRTLRQRHHVHFAGTVSYTDTAGAFYEDFTDEWGVRGYNHLCSACTAGYLQWQQQRGINPQVNNAPCRYCTRYPDDLDTLHCRCGGAAGRLQRLRPYWQAHPHQLEEWKYPQRVDVEKWEHKVPGGVRVDGLSEEAGVPVRLIRNAAFRIPESFFNKVVRSLQARSG
jgi:hypothetical protein